MAHHPDQHPIPHGGNNMNNDTIDDIDLETLSLHRGENNGDSVVSSQPRLHQRGAEIQQFGTLRLLPIALSSDSRMESCQIVNHILSDTVILHSLYKKHHWLMRGATFYQLHLLLDKHASEQLELIDTLAERVQTLGGIAVGDPRHVAEITRIERPPNGCEPVPEMLSRLLEAHELIISELRDGIERTERNGDSGTSDLLTSDVLRRHEIQVWFLAEHLVETDLVRIQRASQTHSTPNPRSPR
jgi:starvation-inducible DNA-binding protein